ncbi:MAG: zf-HC2 domain-containing protein, partial [Actinobacteria bacterium]|nr:zf-HC2 domain-containing protein [Actinomycetota bacterium]
MTEHSGPKSGQAGQHPDSATLAEFREGILSAPDAARIRSHLAGCP